MAEPPFAEPARRRLELLVEDLRTRILAQLAAPESTALRESLGVAQDVEAVFALPAKAIHGAGTFQETLQIRRYIAVRDTLAHFVGGVERRLGDNAKHFCAAAAHGDELIGLAFLANGIHPKASGAFDSLVETCAESCGNNVFGCQHSALRFTFIQALNAEKSLEKVYAYWERVGLFYDAACLSVLEPNAAPPGLAAPVPDIILMHYDIPRIVECQPRNEVGGAQQREIAAVDACA